MKGMLLAEAGRVAHEAAPSFQVVGKVHQTAATPAVNVAGQAIPVGVSGASAPASAVSSSDAVAGSILGNTMSGYFEIVGYLLLVLGGVWLLLWLLRRSGVGMFSPERQIMAIESRLSLGPKKWMVVTRVHGKRLVLGVTDHTITKLAELPPVETVAVPAKAKTAQTNSAGLAGRASQSGALGRGAMVASAKKALQKTSSSVQKKISGEKAKGDDFEKFYAAAQEHEKNAQ